MAYQLYFDQHTHKLKHVGDFSIASDFQDNLKKEPSNENEYEPDSVTYSASKIPGNLKSTIKRFKLRISSLPVSRTPMGGPIRRGAQSAKI